MSASPNFYAKVFHEVVQISTANTARDGTGSITVLYAATDPVTVESVRVCASGTTTAGQVRLFYREANADTWRLLDELSVAALTASATVQPFDGTFANGSFYMPALAEIGVSTHNAETFNVFAQGGRY